jgi:hypothetical protein
MGFKVGEKRPDNAGRKKGTPNKKSMTFIDELLKRNFDFMDEFMQVYNASDVEGRRNMLLKTADYIFPKLKSMEIKSDSENDSVFQFNIVKVDAKTN